MIIETLWSIESPYECSVTVPLFTQCGYVVFVQICDDVLVFVWSCMLG